MAKKQIATSPIIRFRARGAFLKIIEPKAFDGKGEPRWEATFLLDPSDKAHLDGIKNVIKSAGDVAKETWGFVPLELRKLAAKFIPGQAPPPADTKEDDVELAFYNGSRKEYDGYQGMLVIPAHQYASKAKPAIANRSAKEVLPGDKQFPYSGCYVVGSITLWGQDNQFAKRIGVNLRGVQFDRDGEAFGSSDRVPEEEFEALEDDVGAPAADDIGF